MRERERRHCLAKSNKMPETWHRGSSQVESCHGRHQVSLGDSCLPTFSPALFTIRCSLFTVHCSRMFSQQINTTFDTSLLCPQRNRINSSHAPRIIPQPQIHLSSTFGSSSCSSCVLRLATPSLVMVSKVLGHSSFDRLPSSAVALVLALVVARGPRLKPAWPVDTFA